MRPHLVLAWMTVIVACSAEQVTVATISTDAGGGRLCKGNDDCSANEYCVKQTCGDVTGDCELRPLLCDDTQAPSCGCSGMTYWNDCLRMQQGDSAGVSGECRINPRKCMSASDCPSGASCARLVPTPMGCLQNPPGACWVLPGKCPPPSSSQRWEPCGPGMACEDTCTAIRDGRPHHAKLMCP